MPFVPDLAAIHNPSTGGIPTVAWGDAINANDAYLGAAWTSFTPAMSFSGGGSLSIGDGTITGAYQQVGKTVRLRIHLAVGSTTTFGTGTWRFGLPNSTTGVSAVTQAVSAVLFDNSAATYYASVALAQSTNAYLVVTGADASANLVSSTAPFTWATSDSLNITGVLEVA